MPITITDALRAPITDLASGKAWIDALHAADAVFHFEDDPGNITQAGGGDLFADEDVALIRERVDALYAIEWGPKPGMGREYCPIGYSLTLLPFDEDNQAEGCLPGVEEVFRSGNLRLLDCAAAADYEYGAPGRFTVEDVSEDGGHIGDYDTTDEALAANPALAEAWGR
jgi:hypothetical protein